MKQPISKASLVIKQAHQDDIESSGVVTHLIQQYPNSVQFPLVSKEEISALQKIFDSVFIISSDE